MSRIEPHVVDRWEDQDWLGEKHAHELRHSRREEDGVDIFELKSDPPFPCDLLSVLAPILGRRLMSVMNSLRDDAEFLRTLADEQRLCLPVATYNRLQAIARLMEGK
jgi:hypothetical protein